MSDPPRQDLDLDPIERTPRGHDLGLLRDMLALTPTERIRVNSRWVELIEEMRRSMASDEPRSDPPRAARA